MSPRQPQPHPVLEPIKARLRVSGIESKYQLTERGHELRIEGKVTGHTRKFITEVLGNGQLEADTSDVVKKNIGQPKNEEGRFRQAIRKVVEGHRPEGVQIDVVPDQHQIVVMIPHGQEKVHFQEFFHELQEKKILHETIMTAKGSRMIIPMDEIAARNHIGRAQKPKSGQSDPAQHLENIVALLQPYASKPARPRWWQRLWGGQKPSTPGETARQAFQKWAAGRAPQKIVDVIIGPHPAQYAGTYAVVNAVPKSK